MSFLCLMARSLWQHFDQSFWMSLDNDHWLPHRSLWNAPQSPCSIHLGYVSLLRSHDRLVHLSGIYPQVFYSNSGCIPWWKWNEILHRNNIWMLVTTCYPYEAMLCKHSLAECMYSVATEMHHVFICILPFAWCMDYANVPNEKRLLIQWCCLFTGIGFGLMHLCPFVVIGQYFEKRRSLATGIATCGSGVGTIVFPSITPYLISIYNWSGTMWILAGIALNGLVIGFSYFKQYTPSKRKDKKKKKILEFGVLQRASHLSHMCATFCGLTGRILVFVPSIICGALMTSLIECRCTKMYFL